MSSVDYKPLVRHYALFVEEPDETLKCTICTQVMLRPVQCRNGHLYCKECIDKVLASSTCQSECPSCRIKMKVNELSFNMLAAKIIEQQRIHCPTTLDDETVSNPRLEVRKKRRRSTSSTRTSSCTWVGTVGSCNAHLHSCLYARLHCPHDMCEQTPCRQDFSSHITLCPKRPVECEVCLISVPYEDMQDHTTQCTTTAAVEMQCISPEKHSANICLRNNSLCLSSSSEMFIQDTIDEKNEMIASLKDEIVYLKSRATISEDYMNKYPRLVDRCHCNHDVDAWDELNALATAGDKVALSYTILVLGANTGAGTTMRQNLSKANKIGFRLKSWLMIEHDNGNVHATFVLGYLHYNRLSRCNGNGMDYFHVAALKGHLGAKEWLAFGYTDGKARSGTDDVDIKEAIKMLQECMSKGHLEAKFDLANVLIEGHECYEKNEILAMQYYEELSDLNYITAMVNLGKCYEDNTGIRKGDLDLAFAWYKKAADIGDPTAQCNVGYYFLYGVSVEVDIPSARRYFEMAASQGFKSAKSLLRKTNCYSHE